MYKAEKCVDSSTDVPSHVCQFTFASNPYWSRLYAPGPEIQEYLKDVAYKYDVENYVRLQHLFQKADWNEKSQQWTIKLKNLVTGGVGFN